MTALLIAPFATLISQFYHKIKTMENEDLETLLALIEEYDDDCTTDSSIDDTESWVAHNAHEPSKPKRSESARIKADRKEIRCLKAKLGIPGRNRSRDRHRLELLELRVEAALLQQRVDDLEEEERRVRPGATASWMAPNDISLADTTNDSLYDAWRDLAKKHKMHRTNAEIENRNLRELYAHQLKLTHMVKKLFRKQSSIEEQLAHHRAASSYAKRQNRSITPHYLG
ncbi:hypothetical protein F443_20641 [Phytophthora nicotianae P1569]|uniref:Uncharacterized protein n=3 Tax=Phytophthora nicotianae TaxID=4792 RepID=V9E239_PHYNI|nr:hypothetical protein F443_20641 [Phytophthora nicotianae P1569]